MRVERVLVRLPILRQPSGAHSPQMSMLASWDAVGSSGPITLRLQALYFFLPSLYRIELAGTEMVRAIPGFPMAPRWSLQ